jgi:hypothetical protein
MWHGSGGQPMQWESVVALDRGELLKWSGWSGASNSPLDRRRAATSMISADLQWISSHPYDEGGKER